MLLLYNIFKRIPTIFSIYPKVLKNNSGIGASNSIYSPVTGCINPRIIA